jgi:hypothetical protein
MGSKTPITHDWSWFMLSSALDVEGLPLGLPTGERPGWYVHGSHRPRYWLEDMGACFWLGQGTTPHLPGLLPE